MTFWIVVSVLVVFCFALARWSSGRSRGAVPPGKDRHSREAETEQKYGPNPGHSTPPLLG